MGANRMQEVSIACFNWWYDKKFATIVHCSIMSNKLIFRWYYLVKVLVNYDPWIDYGSLLFAYCCVSHDCWNYVCLNMFVGDCILNCQDVVIQEGSMNVG